MAVHSLTKMERARERERRMCRLRCGWLCIVSIYPELKTITFYQIGIPKYADMTGKQRCNDTAECSSTYNTKKKQLKDIHMVSVEMRKEERPLLFVFLLAYTCTFTSRPIIHNALNELLFCFLFAFKSCQYSLRTGTKKKEGQVVFGRQGE